MQLCVRFFVNGPDLSNDSNDGTPLWQEAVSPNISEIKASLFNSPRAEHAAQELAGPQDPVVAAWSGGDGGQEGAEGEDTALQGVIVEVDTAFEEVQEGKGEDIFGDNSPIDVPIFESSQEGEKCEPVAVPSKPDPLPPSLCLGAVAKTKAAPKLMASPKQKASPKPSPKQKPSAKHKGKGKPSPSPKAKAKAKHSPAAKASAKTAPRPKGKAKATAKAKAKGRNAPNTSEGPPQKMVKDEVTRQLHSAPCLLQGMCCVTLQCCVSHCPHVHLRYIRGHGTKRCSRLAVPQKRPDARQLQQGRSGQWHMDPHPIRQCFGCFAVELQLSIRFDFEMIERSTEIQTPRRQ